jgi:DNA repair exonuclease SbcCD ATPase subunit
MNDPNNFNNSPSQPDFSSDRGNWSENWSFSSDNETLEAQLLSPLDFTNATDLNWQKNEPESEIQPALEEQLLFLMETIDSFEESSDELSLFTEAEIVDLETSLAEIESDSTPSQTPSSNETDWFKIAHQLEEQNQELNATIIRLEEALLDSHRQLEEQIAQTQMNEMTLAQKAEELQTEREQITHLTKQLQAYQQEFQQQQSMVANLSKELEISQQQVAQLEREYAFLQEDCNDKAQKLLTMEKSLGELWSRLHRQQRYTLEYKAALEEYLEMAGDRIMANNSSNFPSNTSRRAAQEFWENNRHLPSLEQINSNTFDIEFQKRMEQELAMEVEASQVVEITETEVEPVSSNSQLVPQSRPNWPAPIIAPARVDRAQNLVDLPSFLPTRHSR